MGAFWTVLDHINAPDTRGNNQVAKEAFSLSTSVSLSLLDCVSFQDLPPEITNVPANKEVLHVFFNCFSLHYTYYQFTLRPPT